MVSENDADKTETGTLIDIIKQVQRQRFYNEIEFVKEVINNAVSQNFGTIQRQNTKNLP